MGSTTNRGIYSIGGSILSAGGTVSVTGTRGNTNSDAIVLESASNIGDGTTGSMTIATTGAMKITDGSVTSAGSITLNSSAAITQVAGTFQTPGTLTVNASSQTATFGSTGNNVGQLMIPSGTSVLVNGSFDASGRCRSAACWAATTVQSAHSQ